MPTEKKSMARMVFFYQVLVCVVSVSLIGYLWISSVRKQFIEESQALRTSYIEEQKNLIRREVSHALEFVRYMQSQTEKRLKDDIKTKVYQAYAVAEHLFNTYKKTKSTAEIANLVKEALRPIRFSQGRGYYFAFDLNGVETLFAAKPEMEGKNMLNVRGGNGEYVVADMLKLVKEKGESYYEYAWPKPDELGYYPKIAFVKGFEPLGWIIGTGEYVDDVEKDIQQDVLRWISNIRFNNAGYVFAGQYDGLSLSGPQTGKNMLHVEDVNGVKIVQELIKAAKEGGGFVHYVIPNFEKTKQAPKISYSVGIDDWGWYIGAGVYVDEIDTEIAKMQATLNKQITDTIRKIVLVLCSLVLGMFFLVRLLSKRIRDNLSAFTRFFNDAAHDAVRIDEEGLDFKEFVYLAKSANAMLDIRNRLEEDLHQARKMEAVGNLAGGIAHEFNNVLAIIIGNVELVMDEEAKDSPLHNKLKHIMDASLRAKEVVWQLLNFSRKGQSDKKVIDIKHTVSDVLKLLKASFPSNIRIEQNIPDTIDSVVADATQMHQVLINLCNNSAQAMGENGGVLSLEISNASIDSHPATVPTAKPGQYVKLSISDTGPGIPDEYIDRIFDPYFTTKKIGQGTGMGLAVVHGIIQEHGGWIQLESRKGHGAVFHVYLPASREPAVSEPESPESLTRGGNETLLFVDDDPAIVKLYTDMLSRIGYRVIPETNPFYVTERFKTDPLCCDLVITDMSMPGISGIKLAEILLGIRPDLPIIICTGYSEDLLPDHAYDIGIKNVFTKPVNLKTLDDTIRGLLDSKASDTHT